MFKQSLTKGKIYTSLSLSLLLALTVPIISRAGSVETTSSDKDMLYMKLLNFTMPVVKSVAFSEDEVAEYDFSLKNKALELFGLDVKSPLSIVGREISFLKPTDSTTYTSSSKTKTSFSLNPFKFNDNNVIKNKVQDNNSNSKVEIPNIKATNVYNPKLKKTLNTAKPEVLIYHSHTTESYQPYKDNESDYSKNIVSVGDVITTDLEKNYGIAAIHDKTYHNLGNFYHSYENSGNTLDKYLKQYKDFRLIIDLHRDGGPEKAAVTAKMNDNNLARYMFVIGTGNPNKDSNIGVARKLSSISQTLFPGLIRSGTGGADYGIYYYKSARFNQHKNGHAVLIELGAENNTLDEAKTTGVYLSRIIAEYINGK